MLLTNSSGTLKVVWQQLDLIVSLWLLMQRQILTDTINAWTLVISELKSFCASCGQAVLLN